MKIRLVTKLLMGFAVFASMSSFAFAEFSDVSVSNQYHTSIKWMQDEKVVVGYGDGTFQADRSVSRVEFLKMIYVAKGLDAEIPAVSSNSGFSDLYSDAWYSKYVAFAKARGTIVGYGDGTFRPDREISRVEAMKIVMTEFFGNEPEAFFQSLSENDKTAIEGCENEAHFLADIDSGSWYESFVTYAHSNCLIPLGMVVDKNATTDDGFEPARAMTRGEVAEIIYRSKASSDNDSQKFESGITPRSLTNVEVVEGECAEGTKLFKNEEDGYQFCYDEDGDVKYDESQGFIFRNSEAPELEYWGYFDVDSTREYDGTQTELKNFTNSNGVEGIEFALAAGGWSGHFLSFEDSKEDRYVDVVMAFADDEEVAFMQEIKKTFKFLDLPNVEGECAEGTKLFKNEEDGYQFCYDEDGDVKYDESQGFIFRNSEAPELEYWGYFDVDSTREYDGTQTELKNFTNSNGVEGIEFALAAGGWSGHFLSFEDSKEDRYVDVVMAFADDEEVAFMQEIKKTFKFLDLPNVEGECAEGTKLFKNEEDGYQFCYDEDGDVKYDESQGFIFRNSEAPELEYWGYFDVDSTREYDGTQTELKNFTNSNGVEGIEFALAAGGWSGHFLSFEDSKEDRYVDVVMAFADDEEVAFMQEIKKTFKFLD
jgi:glutaredoxin-related protein